MKKAPLGAALAVVCAAMAYAVDFTALQPQGYVSDFAGVVDAASRAKLEQYCAALERATGAQVALVTLPNVADEPIDQVANDLFRKWGIGHKGKDDGLLLLLSIQDRRSRIEIGYGLEPIITDGTAGDILRAMRPYLRQGRYGDSLLQAANEIGTRIAGARNATLDTPAPEPRQRRPPEGRIPFPVILGGIILFFLLSSLMGGGRRRGGGGGLGGFLPGLIIGSMAGRGWDHTRGGGGFGGFDSGGGFGGFGGGDSGGGGASGSW
ncbi:MAG: TPM domain-containing protein [Acidobacteriota bacterium]